MEALPRQAPTRLTVAEFLDWAAADRSGAAWQLVDGEPAAMAPASQPHAAILAEFSRLLGNHLLDLGSPCRVLVQPGIVPRVRSDKNFRIPDLGVTCSPDATGLMVPDPVLLIEVISPSNEAETRANVWAYATIPSVQEIVIVHSTRIEAEVLRRNDDASWPAAPAIVGPDGRLEIASVGFATPLAALYRTTALLRAG